MRKSFKWISILLICIMILTSGDVIAYADNDGLVYETNGEYATITGYSGEEETVTIPEYISDENGTYTVKAISEDAFENSDTIEYIVFEHDYSTMSGMIENQAFNLLSVVNLESVFVKYDANAMKDKFVVENTVEILQYVDFTNKVIRNAEIDYDSETKKVKISFDELGALEYKIEREKDGEVEIFSSNDSSSTAHFGFENGIVSFIDDDTKKIGEIYTYKIIAKGVTDSNKTSKDLTLEIPDTFGIIPAVQSIQALDTAMDEKNMSNIENAYETYEEAVAGFDAEKTEALQEELDLYGIDYEQTIDIASLSIQANRVKTLYDTNQNLKTAKEFIDFYEGIFLDSRYDAIRQNVHEILLDLLETYMTAENQETTDRVIAIYQAYENVRNATTSSDETILKAAIDGFALVKDAYEDLNENELSDLAFLMGKATTAEVASTIEADLSTVNATYENVKDTGSSGDGNIDNGNTDDGDGDDDGNVNDGNTDNENTGDSEENNTTSSDETVKDTNLNQTSPKTSDNSVIMWYILLVTSMVLYVGARKKKY